jgi:hypothetical protein
MKGSCAAYDKVPVKCMLYESIGADFSEALSSRVFPDPFPHSNNIRLFF